MIYPSFIIHQLQNLENIYTHESKLFAIFFFYLFYFLYFFYFRSWRQRTHNVTESCFLRQSVSSQIQGEYYSVMDD